MKRSITRLLALLLLPAAPAISQSPPNPSDYVANSLTFPLRNPPQRVNVQQVSIQRLDNPGPATYCYWIVSNFTIGNSAPAGPVCVFNGPNSLVNGNSVSWPAVFGANTYDVLRTSVLSPPTGACNCAIATAVNGLSATDTGLNAYTVNTFSPAAFNLVWDNEQTAAGQSQLVLRANGVVIFTINSATGAVFSNTPLSVPSLNTSTRGDRQIILQNPDFEGSSLIPPPGWTNGCVAVGAATLSYETSTQAPGKTQSLKVASSARFQGVCQASVFSVVPGDTYSIQCAAKTDGSGQASCDLQFQDKNGTGLLDIAVTTASTSWQTLNASGTVPVSAVRVMVLLDNSGVTQPSTVWFDQISVQKTNFPGVATVGGVVSKGPSPWVDVTHPTYGAKCDGSTDDTAAFQAAINAAITSGGKIYVPPAVTCVIATQLNFDHAYDVTFRGDSVPSPTAASSVLNPILKFTGNSATALILARSSKGLLFQGLTIQYTNASFSGMIVDLEHAASGDTTDSEQVTFRDMLITGTGSANSAVCGICGDKTFIINIDNVTFGWMVNGVRGENSGGTYAHQWGVKNSNFGIGAAPLSGAAILNPGNAWTVQNNLFEIAAGGVGPGTLTIVDGTASSPLGFTFSGNTVRDTPSTYSGTLFKGQIAGSSWTGNEFEGNASASSETVFSFPSGDGAVTITGNNFTTLAGTLFSFASSNQTQITIDANNYTSFTGTFMSGNPSTGMIRDASNKVTFWGAGSTQINSLSINGDFGMTAGPRMVWVTFIPATIVASTNWNQLNFDKGITITRLSAAVDGSALAGCATQPTITVGGAALTMPNGTAFVDSGAITQNVAAGVVTVATTGGSGCTGGTGTNVNFNVEYRMQ